MHTANGEDGVTCEVRRVMTHTNMHERKTVSKEGSPSKPSFGDNQRSVVLQDPSGVVDHIVGDLLGGEDLVYLNGDVTGEL